jgi:UDP-N-acetylglucosamine--N-acetylmuramyl-(pentapeptide) pyrophosphoryl-undecaprenol N-acetylglucosamine transferase
MEPNAIPGATNKWIARWVRHALINFEETRRYFPEGRTDLTGLPVREEFFNIPPKAPSDEFTILITGGSQGSRTLNNAARDAWPLFLASGLNVRFIHQTGAPQHTELARGFAASGLKGEVVPFINDMPGAFAQADLIVCRSGAGAVSELAAAGKPSILIPFPFAADDHQTSNAKVLERAGAAIRSTDKNWTGESFFSSVRDLAAAPERLTKMSEAARTLAHKNAATRAAEILLSIGERTSRSAAGVQPASSSSKNIDSTEGTSKQ